MFFDIWKYRHFIYSCVKRDFFARYKGSILGVIWAIFQPLSMIFVYTVIFSDIMKSKLTGMENVPYAYSIYLCSGILMWGLFTETVRECSNVFLNNANLIKKVFFPRICLPCITVCSAFINFIIGFIIFLLFLLISGNFPWNNYLYFFLVITIQIIFSVGLGIGLGVLNVFFRDVGQFLNIILQFWFWFTPVVYPYNIIPEKLRIFMELNPMYHIVHSYQVIFVYNESPNLFGISIVLVIGLLISIWALYLYKKHVGEMVDEL